MATWNIKHGAPHPEHLAAAVRALAGVDVLALQEVDVGDPRSGSADQVAVVADALGMASVFGRALTSRRGGDYGNALLVRGDLTADLLELPGPGQARAALLAIVDLGPSHENAMRLSVATTHLAVDRGVSGPQLVAVLERLDAMPGPRLLLGDLNRSRRQLPGAAREVPTTLTFARGPRTFPARCPRLRIDHIATSNDLTLSDLVAVRLPLSDHRALTATVATADRPS